ncbi:DoxX family membrane protein [Sunxiuqinia elliptica]
MKYETNYTKLQTYSLVLLRWLIGWHILYEGIAKLLNPDWSSLGFLQQAQGIMSGFAGWVTSHPTVLSTVDFLNTWGLIAIGVGLLLGICARTAAWAGAILVFTYYLTCPPLIGVEYPRPVDGNNLIVDKTLLESIALVVLAVFPTSAVVGLDAIIQRLRTRRNGGVK